MTKPPIFALALGGCALALALSPAVAQPGMQASPMVQPSPMGMQAAPTMDATATSAMAPSAMAPSAPVERSEQDVARRARVYARVGDVAVTVGDIEDAIEQQSPFLRVRYRDPAKLRELADGLVRFELLAREAARLGYAESGAVEQQVEQQMVQRLIEKEIDERITRESIPQEDVQAYYDAHAAEFSRPAMVRASHILLPNREAADALLAEARDADNREFRALARQHSIDTETKLRGGDLRYFTNTGRPPNANEADPPVDAALVQAAFELDELGEVGGPVAVGDGSFSIVKLTGRREAETREIGQAQEGIRLRLWRERRQEAVDELVSGLRERAQVETHPERMRPIRLAPVEPAEGLPNPHGREALEDGRDPTESGQAAEAPEAAE